MVFNICLCMHLIVQITGNEAGYIQHYLSLYLISACICAYKHDNNKISFALIILFCQ
jgi:hypothetical protein